MAPNRPVTLKSLGDYSYIWPDGSTDSTFIVPTSGYYDITATNICGTNIKQIYVEYLDVNNTFFPNVITPNDDGKNDLFILDKIYLGGEMSIYNRWGKMIYHSESYQSNWEGNNLPVGTYFYVFSHECLNSTIKGRVTIIR